MAQASPNLIDALRTTAHRLESGVRYEWGHVGRCNCGHLVQTVTSLSAREIARVTQMDEWTEHARAYCPASGHQADDIFRALAEIGFEPQDFAHLEYLSDRTVLARLGEDRYALSRNDPKDVARYMHAMAESLEEVR